MKLLFNKNDFHGEWFQDDYEDNNYTEKVPQSTGYYFDEESNNWLEIVDNEE